MKKNSYFACFSQILATFAGNIINKMKKISLAIKRVDIFRFIHSWIIPFFHATVWMAGLFCALKSDTIFSYDHNRTEIINFLTIFVTLFIEVMITLLDLYVDRRAYYLAPRFILFIIVLLAAVVGTAICAGLAFSSDENSGGSLLGVLIFSSSLKFIEILLVNNQNWYIVTKPNIIDARGTYFYRALV